MPVQAAHLTVGAAVVALNLIAGLWALATWRRARAVSTWLNQLLALTHTIVLLQAAFGLYLLAGNYRAARLHYVYGLLPVGAVAFGYPARTADARRNLAMFAVIALVVAGLAARAFMTGTAS